MATSQPIDDVVITGMGVVSPLAIGVDETFQALLDGRSGVGVIDRFDTSDMALQIGSEVKDFKVRPYVTDRKRIKLMSREMQHGFAAAKMAADEANLSSIAPERLGVVFGMEDLLSEPEDMEQAVRHCTVDGCFDYSRWGAEVERFIAPIVMLRYLPNMAASHISIELDARGPCNTIVSGGVSAFVAVIEAAHLVKRGVVDAVITGGASSRINPEMWIRNIYLGSSQRNAEPQRACRPFDVDRDGMVNGEGGAAFILESAEHAARRNAEPLARIVSATSGFSSPEIEPAPGRAIRHGIKNCLQQASLDRVDHVSAHGLSTVEDDRAEATAIRDVLGDVPVTAPKANLGNLGGGGAAVELAMTVASINHSVIPATLNYETPSPDCPINVVHGKAESRTDGGTALVLNHAITGQATAILLASP